MSVPNKDISGLDAIITALVHRESIRKQTRSPRALCAKAMRSDTCQTSAYRTERFEKRYTVHSRME